MVNDPFPSVGRAIRGGHAGRERLAW